ncbi:TauD/TfdA family dioxygenase [Plantactinospora sp. WMMC1484]|uniref:TauD/TfdA family dioxygenase n=1 Tax=Plantactinospora sp. WMMC1484 TaxID=3404122 RepID=UPI003BF4B84F
MNRPTDRPATPYRVELSTGERTELDAVARQLARTPPSLVDDADWLSEARRLGCHVPVRLREAIRRYRHSSGPDGLLLITNLPIVDDGRRPTPTEPDSVERLATVPACVAMLLGQELGEVIAYREEKQGALVQNVVPVRALARSQSNGGSVPLELHCENAFHPHRPDFVGLVCLRQGQQEQVGTSVAAIRPAVAQLGERHRTTLRQPRFVTDAPPSFRSGEPASAHPVLDGSASDPDVRVDFNATRALDEEADEALRGLREAVREFRTVQVLRPGEMVFLDNRVVMHGRDAFAPRYDGRDRWLHRVFVHLDHRRSRARRAGDGPVLS